MKGVINFTFYSFVGLFSNWFRDSRVRHTFYRSWLLRYVLNRLDLYIGLTSRFSRSLQPFYKVCVSDFFDVFWIPWEFGNGTSEMNLFVIICPCYEIVRFILSDVYPGSGNVVLLAVSGTIF